MLAESDLGQVIFIIIFLLVGFVQWVIKVIKEKAATAERNRHVPTQAEVDARRSTWEQQTRPEPTAPRGDGLGDLLGEFRKAMENASHPPAPPPLPTTPPRSRHASREDAVHTHTHTHAAPAAAAMESQALPGITLHSGSLAASRRRPHPLTALLHTPEGYRQAFVLREVLGPPRGLREYHGPED